MCAEVARINGIKPKMPRNSVMEPIRENIAFHSEFMELKNMWNQRMECSKIVAEV